MTQLYDKIYGCWLGKNIGGTLGTPVEGQKNPKPLPFEFPKVNEPNDDLDLQLVWFDLIRRRGLKLTADDFSDAWLNHISYPYDEYGIARANLLRGLKAPVTGVFNNYFLNCMGSPIRSEIWGCIAAGNPAAAAGLARMDAEVDHYDEGVYGEIFFAVIEAMAFQDSDLPKLTAAALEYLPESSLVKKAVARTLEAYLAGVALPVLRDELIALYDAGNFSHCILNIAFTIAGLLYEEGDFLRSMITAINLGYDTDCTGATSGAIAGIILGEKKLRELYHVEFDNRIMTGWGVFDIQVPDSIEGLTEACVKLHKELETMKEVPTLPKFFELPKVDVSALDLNRRFRVGAFDSAEEAQRELAAAPVHHSPVDVLDLSEFVRPGKKLYLLTTVSTREPAVRIIGHSNAHTRTWVNGTLAAEIPARDFAPSPHRHWGRSQPLPEFNGSAEVLVELCEPGKQVDFQLMVAVEDGKFPVPEFTLA